MIWMMSKDTGMVYWVVKVIPCLFEYFFYACAIPISVEWYSRNGHTDLMMTETHFLMLWLSHTVGINTHSTPKQHEKHTSTRYTRRMIFSSFVCTPLLDSCLFGAHSGSPQIREKTSCRQKCPDYMYMVCFLQYQAKGCEHYVLRI